MSGPSNRVVDLATWARRKAEIAEHVDAFFALHEGHHVSPRPKDPLDATVEWYTCNTSFQLTERTDEKGRE